MADPKDVGLLTAITGAIVSMWVAITARSKERIGEIAVQKVEESNKFVGREGYEARHNQLVDDLDALQRDLHLFITKNEQSHERILDKLERVLERERA